LAVILKYTGYALDCRPASLRLFEQRKTPEACIVKAMDALQPILTHMSNEGRSWRENGISREQVANRAGLLRQVAPALWERVEAMLDTAQQRGWLL